MADPEKGRRRTRKAETLCLRLHGGYMKPSKNKAQPRRMG